MPYNVFPSVRAAPVVFTLLIALAAAVLAGATSGAAQERMRNPGFGRNAAIVAEQRRHAASLEKIEQAISRLQADVALLNARIEGAGTPNREAAAAVTSAAALNRAPGNPVPNDPGQGNPPLNGPEFDLGALRASFDAEAVNTEAVTPGSRKELRRHPRRVGKGNPSVRI
jgi:hypothetical protein